MWFGLLYAIYLIFAVSTYITMFVVLFRSRIHITLPQQSLPHTIIDSKFFVAVLLIATFLLLGVLPQVIYTMIYPQQREARVKHHYGSHQPFLILGWLFYLSDTLDGFIYILMYKPVKNLVVKQIRGLSCIYNGRAQQEAGVVAIRNTTAAVVRHRR